MKSVCLIRGSINYIIQNLNSIEFPLNRIIKSDSILSGSYLVHYTNIAFYCDEIPFTTCYTLDARRPISVTKLRYFIAGRVSARS